MEDRCRELGGTWVGNRCVIKDIDRAAGKVLSCVEREVDKVPIDKPVELDDAVKIAKDCLRNLTENLRIDRSTIKKIAKEATKFVKERERDPSGWVYDENKELVGVLTPFTRPADFKIKWVSIDAWRGYYDVIPSPNWSALHVDTILAGSEDARELEDFETLLCSYLKLKKIPFRIVITETSNVFSENYYIFVPSERKAEVEKYARSLAKVYRDPLRFTATALLGHDPPYTAEELAFLSSACELLKSGRKIGIAGETIRDECEGL